LLQALPLYSTSTLLQYARQRPNELLPPHIFQIAGKRSGDRWRPCRVKRPA
jgi:hypothetical protein